MSAFEGRLGLVGVVDRDAGLFVLGEGDVDRGTGADTIFSGSSIVVPHSRLEDVTGTELESLQQAILETKGVVVAQEGVGGKTSCHSEFLVPLVEQEVVGETDIEASGKLHLCLTGFDGEIVATGTNHLKGETRAIKAHRGTPVLEGDTELEFIVLTCDVLDTCIDAEAGAGDIVGALSDHFEHGTTMDATGEAMCIANIDGHVAGRKGTIVTLLRAKLGSDGDIAKTHRHDINADDTSIEDSDTETKGVDGGTTGEATFATIKHGVGVGHLNIFDESQSSDVAEHSIQATHIRDIDTSPAGTASPRVDKQLRGAGGTTAFVIAGLGRRDGNHREKHNYSKYSKYIFHLCNFLVVSYTIRIRTS